LAGFERKHGFGGSLHDEPFCTIHDDLIIETRVNKEVNERGGPMQGVYSTSILAADTLSKTSHIMAKLRSAIKKRLHILTSSTHKETSLGARQKHEVIIQRLVKQLDHLLDPFAPGSA